MSPGWTFDSNIDIANCPLVTYYSLKMNLQYSGKILKPGSEAICEILVLGMYSVIACQRRELLACSTLYFGAPSADGGVAATISTRITWHKEPIGLHFGLPTLI